MKVVEIAYVQVLGSVEDERTFNTLSFIKNRLRNSLTVNLETCVAMYAQKFYSLEKFLYGAVFVKWQLVKNQVLDN